MIDCSTLSIWHESWILFHEWIECFYTYWWVSFQTHHQLLLLPKKMLLIWFWIEIEEMVFLTFCLCDCSCRKSILIHHLSLVMKSMNGEWWSQRATQIEFICSKIEINGHKSFHLLIAHFDVSIFRFSSVYIFVRRKYIEVVTNLDNTDNGNSISTNL